MTTFFYKNFNHLKFHIILTICQYFFLFIVCYIYSNQCLFILIKPLIVLTKLNYFIYTDIREIFFIKIILSMYISTILILLFSFFNFWFFLSPGLYKKENYLILNLLIFIYIFFFLINTLIFLKIIPNILNFFINFEDNSNNYLFNIYLEPKIYEYVSILIKLLFIINLILFYPNILIILLFLNYINIQNIYKLRKFIYLKLVILSNIITLPDIWNQLLIILVFIFFFEIIMYFISLYNYK